MSIYHIYLGIKGRIRTATFILSDILYDERCLFKDANNIFVNTLSNMNIYNHLESINSYAIFICTDT